jgi:hypothetical protein
VRDRLRSSTSAWGAPSVHISDDGMQYPRRRPIASSIMGFEDEAEQLMIALNLGLGHLQVAPPMTLIVPRARPAS